MTAPLLLFDLDGTIVNTNMNARGSAKYEESYSIVAYCTGNPNLDQEKFEDFYFSFHEQALNLTMDESSLIFAVMLKDSYGVSLDEKEFVRYRAAKRVQSYSTLVRFIGTENRHNGAWLEEIPNALRKNMYMITSSPRPTISLINQNPFLQVNNGSIEDFFGNRIITADDVTQLKPNPEGYNKALQRIRPSKNKQKYCGMAFEDSSSGIRAACDAQFDGGKLFVVGVESTSSSTQLKEFGAHYTSLALHDIDIMDLLKKAGF